MKKYEKYAEKIRGYDTYDTGEFCGEFVCPKILKKTIAPE